LPWNPNLDSDVNSIIADNGLVYLAGGFNTASSITRTAIAAVTNASGALVTSFNASVTITASEGIRDIKIFGSTLYAAGSFSGLGGYSRSNVGAVNKSNGAGISWDPNADDLCSALEVGSALVHIGGQFTQLGGTSCYNLGTVSRATGGLSTSNYGMLPLWTSPHIMAIKTYQNTKVFIGGDFETSGGLARYGLAAVNPYNGATDASFIANIGGSGIPTIKSLALTNNGLLIAGGYFTTIGGISRAYLAALIP
jgi:hypothetical protein